MANKRKPNRLKILEGTDRPSRMYDEPEFELVKSDVDPPEWLGDEGRKLWVKLITILRNNSVLTEPDLTALAHLCKTHESVVKAYDRGQEPTAAKLTQLRLQIIEFGLTPASRSRIDQTGSEGDMNPFKDL